MYHDLLYVLVIIYIDILLASKGQLVHDLSVIFVCVCGCTSVLLDNNQREE